MLAVVATCCSVLVAAGKTADDPIQLQDLPFSPIGVCVTSPSLGVSSLESSKSFLPKSFLASGVKFQNP
jgi:hypothetical protein